MVEVDAMLAAVIAGYRLNLGRTRFRGRVGSQRGRGIGGSMEFLDFRDYTPGDDLRHLDWRGYARTEQLRVRLHQDEVAPLVDLLVDDSASMLVTSAKELAARQLLTALQSWSRQAGMAVRTLRLGGGFLTGEPEFADMTATAQPPNLPLRPGAVRVLLTDGLWQQDPSPVLHRLQAGAAQLLCLQLLDPTELQPIAAGAVAMRDIETGEFAEVQLDAAGIAAYQRRLQRCIEVLRQLVVRSGGVHAVVRARPFERLCAEDLLAAGVVEPA